MKCTNGRTLYSDSQTRHSDTDWIEDGQEVKMVATYQYSQPYTKCKYLFTEISDPKKDDTDGDGLNDKEEQQIGTQPMNADTDGDKILDGDDIYPLTPYEFEETYFWDSASYNVNTNKWNVAPIFVNVEDGREISGILNRFYSNIAIENSANFGYINDQE